MTLNLYGEMPELLLIYAAALALGVISGLLAVHIVTTRTKRFSLRTLCGVVALTAILARLAAAKPAFSSATIELWLLATVVIAVFDLAVCCIVDPWRGARRFSERSLHRLRVWLPPAVIGAVAGALAVLKWHFDIPLNPDLLPSFAMYLTLALVGLAVLDLVVRVTSMGLRRRRRMNASGCSPRA